MGKKWLGGNSMYECTKAENWKNYKIFPLEKSGSKCLLLLPPGEVTGETKMAA